MKTAKTVLYALLAGSFFLGCSHNVKKDKEYVEVDCGHSWVYKVNNEAMPSVNRVLYLKVDQTASDEEKKKKSLQRFLIMDKDRDMMISEEEAKDYEEKEVTKYQKALQNEDQKKMNLGELLK